MARYALILAGGRGTRFWPRSRTRRAKQVLEFLGAGSLIQQTVERLAPVVPPERVWVLTNQHLREEIAQQLKGVPERQILAEPAQRNTAPPIGLAAHILQSLDADAVMGVFPADHIIAKPDRFLPIVKAAYRAAEKGQMALIGIQPRWPETGYGYLEFPKTGVSGKSGAPVPVVRFREKPDLATAIRFVEAGHFAWNAGMFFWRADVFQEALRKHLPETAGLLDSLPAFGSPEFEERLAETFPKCENISVDYAVLEKSQGVVGYAADDVGWSDVGSFSAVYELMQKDEAGNAGRGEFVTLDAQDNYVDAAGKVVALLGVQDLIVVDTPDALLVTTRANAQRVGELVKMLEKRGRGELL